MVFNRLNETSLQIESMIAEHGPSPDPAVAWVINEKITEFAADIHKNGEALVDYLIKHQESLSRLQKIGQIKVKWSTGVTKKIYNACALLEWKVLFKEGNPEKLARWVLKNECVSSENNTEFFRELSHLRKMLIAADLLNPVIGFALSKRVTFALGLSGQKSFHAVKNPFSCEEEKLEALAHWINSEEISLYELNLSKSQLTKLAPYLHFVDFRYMTSYKLRLFGVQVYEQPLTEDDLAAFFKLCSHAYSVLICDKSMTELKHLPAQVRRVGCILCKNMNTIDLSHSLHLELFFCLDCPIRTLDFSHNLKLESIHIVKCQNLTSLGDSLPNTLEQLTCDKCPNLNQLPQMPQAVSVITTDCGCGEFNSFHVFPAELEVTPSQVLLDLGKILLQNRPIPNIVYMDPVTGKPSAGLDAGGLRRQLVATLCENLFKEGSHFPFVKEGDYAIPVLEDITALRAFARLLGLGIPTGTNLHPSFFHSLFALNEEELAQVAIPLPEPLKKKLYMARHGLDHFDEKDTLEMAEESNILTGAALVAKELQTLLGPRFRRFGQNIEAFITHVQGSKVTKENLKESILCKNTVYKNWINNFIDDLKSDELKDLTLLLTGSYTLSEGAIIFEVYHSRKYVESATLIHTCCKTMSLPGDLNQDLLHKELKAQLSLLKSFNAT